MQQKLKRKSQSLPKLKLQQFKNKTNSLVKLIQKQSLNELTYKKQYEIQELVNQEQQEKNSKFKNVLMKSHNLIDQNKQKISIAKKFRIQKKKSFGAFLTGLDIYKNQQIKKDQENQQNNKQKINIDIKAIVQQSNFDDLAELRKMIKKTNKNLGQYKKQTLNIQKNLIKMADRYDPDVNLLTRKRIQHKVPNFQDQI